MRIVPGYRPSEVAYPRRRLGIPGVSANSLTIRYSPTRTESG